MILGIDPGAKGGVALLGDDLRPRIACRMPVVEYRGKRAFDPNGFEDFFGEHISRHKLDQIVIEQVHAMPGQGVSSTFQFGRLFGGVETMAMYLKAPMTYVTPAVWKKHFGLGQSKRASLDMCKLRFGPANLWDVLANEGISEAALIALWWAETRGARAP